MCIYCSEGWRFETVVLGGDDAGQVKAVLHPVSAQWENTYSAPSSGSILLATRDPAVEDIWPGATGIYISQVMEDGTRRARFGGYVEAFQGSGGGGTTLAIKSMDAFLDHRLMVGPDAPYSVYQQLLLTLVPGELNWSLQIWKPATPTTETFVYGFPSFPVPGIDSGDVGLAAFLVNMARGGFEGEGQTGIPTLSAVADEPYGPYLGVPPDIRTIARWWDFKNIGQAVRELVESEDGPKYWAEHIYTDGHWETILHFSDTVGAERDYTILSDREAKEYALEIDAENKATRVYGVGAGEEGYTAFSVAYDADGIDNLPEHQATVAWKDQTNTTVLDSLTAGYVSDHRDPVTVPSATLYGLPIYDTDSPDFDPQTGFPGPEILQPGDSFNVEIGYGVITVHDLRAKCLAVAWALEQGSPAQRTIAMQPVIRPNTSVRTQTPAKAAAPTQPVPKPGVPAQTVPWPTPGLVSKIGAPLTEVSGMQTSKANPGHIWVFNDEKQTPQVHLVKRSTGVRVGSFTPNPGVSAAPVGDPEAIRLARSTGKLVLADTGDNDLDRPTSGANQPSLLVVPEPKGTGAKGKIPATRLPVAYPAGERINVETLLIHPTTEQVFLVSKETGQARVFSYGTLSSMNTTNNVGTLVATLTNISEVSDGTHTWSGDFILFRTKTQATQVFSDGWHRVGTIPTPAMTKSEAITAESACAFLTTTEGTNPPIYRVLIPTKFGATCTTPEGPDGDGTGGTTTSGSVPGQVINMQGWKLQLPI